MHLGFEATEGPVPWVVFDGPVEPFESLQPLLTGAPHFARLAVRQAHGVSSYEDRLFKTEER